MADPCELNSDGPTFFGVSALDEYALAHATLGLDVRQVARWSIEASHAPEAIKQTSLAGLDEAMQR